MRHRDLLQDPVGPTLPGLAAPMVLMLGIASIILFNVVDTFYVGQLGTRELPLPGGWLGRGPACSRAWPRATRSPVSWPTPWFDASWAASSKKLWFALRPDFSDMAKPLDYLHDDR